MKYWIVKGSPAENGDFDFIQLDQPGRWRTKRPPRDWAIGDRLLFWASSPRLELIALGEFLGETEEYSDEGHRFYRVHYLTGVLDRPLRLAELRAEPSLRNAIFLKAGPATSVVRLSVSEGEHLYRMVISHNSAVKGIWPELEGEQAALPDIDESALEGDKQLVQHLRRERKRALVESKKKKVLAAQGRLSCEVCGFDFRATYGDLGDGFCEVHHKLPLASLSSASTTRLEDLAILCSNCHRMIHRSACALSIEQLRNVLCTKRAATSSRRG